MRHSWRATSASAASKLTTGKPVSPLTPKCWNGKRGSMGAASGRQFTRPVSSLPVSAMWGLWLARSGRVDTGGVSATIHSHNNDKGKHNATQTENRRPVRQRG